MHDDIKPPISGGQEQTTDTQTETERRRPSHKKPCGRCVITAVDSPWLAARADTRCFTFLPASEPRVKQTPDCAQVLFSAYSAEKARYASRKAVLASQRQAGMQAGGSFWGVVALQRGLGTFRQPTHECLLHRLHQQSWRAATATQHTASARISAMTQPRQPIRTRIPGDVGEILRGGILSTHSSRQRSSNAAASRAPWSPKTQSARGAVAVAHSRDTDTAGHDGGISRGRAQSKEGLAGHMS